MPGFFTRRGVVIATIALTTAVLAGVVAEVASSGHGAHAHAATRAHTPRPRDRGATVARTAPQAIDPRLFGPGACVAFPPTSGDQNETVFLDAGHGGVDPGAVGSTESGARVEESTVNLAIELDAMRLLRARGYRVVVSRTQNTSVTRLGPGDTSGGILTDRGSFADVAARDVCANLAGANVLIGLYMDAGYGEGCLTGYDAARPFSAANQRLATFLQDDVLGAMNARGYQIPNDGVARDNGLGSALTSADVAYGHLLLLGPAKRGYFSTPSKMPGALIEPLYLTDPFEGSVAVSAAGQRAIAGGIAQAVGQYFASEG